MIGEDIDLETVLQPGDAWARVDVGQIEQVILNLVINSRDAMPKGGKVRIEIEQGSGPTADSLNMGAQPDRWVMLSVSDSGSGMSPDIVSKIFEPFFTTKTVGTGLGLSTVYGIVRQTGGDVSVSSQPGHGTTFRIYLPGADAPDEVQAPILTGREPGNRGSETILLVEDEASVRKLAHRALEVNGYKVLVAADGGDALLICERHDGTIHLLLTDVIMPNIGGPEVYKRAVRMRPDLQVLFMSGYTDQSVLQNELLGGTMAFIQKPFKPRRLATEARKVLDRTTRPA